MGAFRNNQIIVYHAFKPIRDTKIFTLREFQEFQRNSLHEKGFNQKKETPDFYLQMRKLIDNGSFMIVDRQDHPQNKDSKWYTPRHALVESFDWQCLDDICGMGEGASCVVDLASELISFIDLAKSAHDNSPVGPNEFKILNIPYNNNEGGSVLDTRNVFNSRGEYLEAQAFSLKPDYFAALKKAIDSEYGRNAVLFE